MTLLEKFRKGELRAMARLITLAENKDPQVPAILSELHASLGRAKVIGITGPPGAGKSTLTGELVRRMRAKDESVAVIAVDPVSPFSGGALLGDRIRLVEHFNDPKVFIRSLSTRGKLGGLSLATRQVVHAVDAFGFDNIIVETVGVGQSEVDVRKIADLALVVLVPEWGDAIQTLKAGLLEIGDVFLVNKADREGAEKLANELKTMLQIAGKDDSRVTMTSVKDPASVDSLFAMIGRYFDEQKAAVAERRQSAAREAAHELLESFVLEEARRWVDANVKDEPNPYKFFAEFAKRWPAGSLFVK